MKDKSKYYIDQKEFYDEICKSKKLPKATDAFGLMVLKLIEHIMHSPCYSNYGPQTKEDMRTEAIYKCMKALDSFDISRGAKSAFCYWTAAVTSGLLGALAKHYKQCNIKREMTKQELINWKYGNQSETNKKIEAINEIQREIEQRKAETKKKKEEKRKAKGKKKV